MYLVPILKAPRATPALTQFWIFLERNGNHLLELPDITEPEAAIAAAKEFLATNELSPSAEPFCVGDIVYAPVDHTDPDLASFYSWKEVAPGSTPIREAWRMFLWVTDPRASTANATTSGDPWGVNRLLETVRVAEPSHTIFSVLNTYLANSETLRQTA
jgi:hypothetical protein